MFRVLVSFASVLALGVGCAKPVVFQGDRSLTITGSPPPAEVAPVEPPRVEVKDNKIVITEKIQFEWNKATILPVSFDLLNQIAKVITENPHIKKLQIEGHASSDGNEQHNLRLSRDRAAAVMRYLVEHGIAKAMLVSKGFGITQPIGDNATQAGREQNRRVEFNILEQDITQRKVEIGPDGKEKVIEEKKQASAGGNTAPGGK